MPPTKKAAPPAVAKKPGEPPEPAPAPVDDATAEDLALAEKYGLTADQVREIRALGAPAVAAFEAVALPVVADDGMDPNAPICGVHWPNGWPFKGVHADCEHGTWKR